MTMNKILIEDISHFSRWIISPASCPKHGRSRDFTLFYVRRTGGQFTQIFPGLHTTGTPEGSSVFPLCALRNVGQKKHSELLERNSLLESLIKNILSSATIKFWSFLAIKIFSKSAFSRGEFGLKATALKSLQKLLSYGSEINTEIS